MATLISVLTNQFFLIFLAIALGLALGKIKIGNFSLGVSGGIFSGIVIGFIAQTWAKGVQEANLATPVQRVCLRLVLSAICSLHSF